LPRIDVRLDRPVGTVDRRIFGSFTEHLGRCIYGGLLDEGSGLSDGAGFRKDVLAATRDLGVSTVRWPGGNFVSGYHWTDGIGPVAGRPRRPELAWQAEEPNRFGTDEFLAWSAAAGAEPVLCLNMGTGTLDEALAWVEYCNGTGDTYWAGRRRGNGHAEPYRVRYWGLGNEMYGDWQIGQRTAADYVTHARQWAKALKRLDPDIRLVSCGQTGVDEWDRIVIDGLAPFVDLHSIHLYTGAPDYWSNVLAPHFAERALSVSAALIDRARYLQRIGHEIGVAYDEWNVWFRHMTGGLEERYTFADALAVGTYLNIFVRNCDWVRMANLAQMVNAIAPIVTTPEAAVVQPIYYPVLLHARAALDAAVDAFVDGDTVNPELPPDASRWPHHVADLGPFTLVDASASVTDHMDRVAVTLVNRGPDAEEVRISLRDYAFGGSATLTTVTEGGDGDRAPLPGIATAHVEEGTENPKDGTVVLTLPPRSFTVAEAAITPR
jgi:alpha-N-arabinofuranosidase